MKTCVAQTSIDAYSQLDLNNQQQEIVATLKILGESCISDITAYLDWERSTVSARLNDLKKINAVIYVGDRKSNRTGIKSEHWRLRDFSEMLF